MRSVAEHPPLDAQGFFFIALALMGLLRWLWPVWVFGPGPWNWSGLVLVAAGVAVALAGSQAFGRAGTTRQPFVESTALVTSGVYRYSRNPMYLGMVLALLGVGLILGALTPFVVVPAFTWLVQRSFIAIEEQMLTAKFGATYTAYQRRVRRWI